MVRPVVKREAGWLLFDAPVPERVPQSCDGEDFAAALLGLSASLPARCKYAWVGSSDLRLRAEHVEPAESDMAIRIAEVDAGFAVATDPVGVATSTLLDGVETSLDVSPPDIASLCREAGWLFEERSDGTLAVDLGVSGAYVPAIVEARASGIAIEASIVTPLPEMVACRAALADLLLRANGAFKMMRAALRSNQGESQAVLEAPLPIDATASDVRLALGAVAVAARHCAVEAQMLAVDEQIARAYLGRFPSEDRRAAVVAFEDFDPGVGLISSQP